MATWVIISGSPYAKGKCHSAATALASKLRLGNAHTLQRSTMISNGAVRFFSCVDLTVHGCIGCDRCKDSFTCIYKDDQTELMAALDAADAVLIISPIYFAGVPSQFKAVLDRFQPYFWKRQKEIDEGCTRPTKRPLYVALVGEGGDPYGSDPALAQIASPFALANFAVHSSHTFIRANLEDILLGTEALIFGSETFKENEPLDTATTRNSLGVLRP